MNEQTFAVKEYEDKDGTLFDVIHVPSGYSVVKGDGVIEDKEFAQTYVDILHENVEPGDIYQATNGEWGCKRGLSDDCGIYWAAADGSQAAVSVGASGRIAINSEKPLPVDWRGLQGLLNHYNQYGR